MQQRFGLLMCFFCFAIVCSCTIQKRLHRPGFHIEWKHRNTERQEETAAGNNRHRDSIPEKLVREASAQPEEVAFTDSSVAVSPVRPESGLRAVFLRNPTSKATETLKRTPQRPAAEQSMHARWENREEAWTIIFVIALIVILCAVSIWLFYAYFNPPLAYILLGIAAFLAFLLFYAADWEVFHQK